MEITTKYNVNDIVYTMDENRIVPCVVQKIIIKVTPCYEGVTFILEEINIYYTLILQYSDRKIKEILENNIFGTKEELIKSL